MKDGKVVIVIGHRMGKGQNIVKGIEKAGGIAILIPGMLADMKLGDVMKENDADIGLSFCGSGGAGALNANTKYGYKETHSLRSVDQGVNAIKEGYKVLGFGFLDTEELGEQLTKTYYSKIGRE